ncbi:MAG: hypothetical protein ACI9OJ_003934 [Myxococcota bacterium]|jgi:hypothetical protein
MNRLRGSRRRTCQVRRVVGFASAAALLPRLVFTMWGDPEVTGWQCRLVWDLARFGW